ncbi:MAG: sigma-70 family RNA polymerase sigma factor [Pseudomonadota bacterium]
MTARPYSLSLKTYVDEREKLIAIACRIVDDHAAAEDLVQESWLRWQQKDYPDEKALAAFKRIVINLAKDLYRRRQTEKRVFGDAIWQSSAVPDSELILLARQDLRLAVSALRELPPRSVKAFKMHCADGLNCAEIGRRLGLSRSRAHELVENAMVHVMLGMRRV